MSYRQGVHDLGDELFAYLQPDGGWGWSNAGLICDGPNSLLVDTLFDRRLTERMLSALRRASAAAAEIDTLVNTHANGDHCYGNELVRGARIVASQRTAAEMPELPPAAFAAIKEQAANMGELGAFFLDCFGAFECGDLELVLPEETFSGELELRVGDREVRLIEVGPAHTRGDTLVHVPDARVVFSGDILFHGAHPVAWAGPVSNWIAACERILALDVKLIVPGHGPLAEPAAVVEVKAYFEYLYERGRELHAQGLGPVQAARALSLDRWAQWDNHERLAVNLATLFGELDGAEEPVNTLQAFSYMAELAGGSD
jgi:glyoxylase-like metal-dependent hydrolase (beta-lactamase superfamily II)